MYMKPFLPFVLFLFLFACTQKGPTEAVTPQQIETAISNGLFSKAEALIKEYIHSHSLPYKEQQKWLFQIEKMNRIRMDFMATDSSVLGFIQNYYNDTISKQQIRVWEEGKALEYKIIDGKKRYFNHAARNLFRISLTAGKQWEKVHGKRSDSLERFLSRHIPQVVKNVQTTRNPLSDPQTMKVTYTLTVKPNAVPPGELVRAWMPFPRSDVRRQGDVNLIYASQSNFVVAPDNCAHKSIYMEKRAVIDQPTTFTYSFIYTSYAEWFDFNAADIKMYNTQSDLYQDYTMEQAPHILFSDRIKERTREVVGNEQNPYLKVRKIYDWIDKNFPWASAREYSTIDNIPEYVLDNNHGDCGQVTLLFITMARCAGVPAKWQSGWMMHPGNKNLHDWAEVYFEGIGWVPVDQSFGRQKWLQNANVHWYYTKGIDAYRLIVNQEIGRDLFPIKVHPRSETVDFQRGEVEWRGGNLYFDQWRYNMDIEYIDTAAPVHSEKFVSEQELPRTQTHIQQPYTDFGYRRIEEDRYKGYYSGLYGAPNGSYPSSTQYYGDKADEVFKNYNQRSYLRGGEWIPTYPNIDNYLPPDRDNYYRYDPAHNSTYQYDPYPRYDPYPSDYYRYAPSQSNSSRYAPAQSNSSRYDPYQGNSYRYDPYQSNSSRYDPYQNNSYRYDPAQYDSFRYNSQYNNSYAPYSRIEDNSVSSGFPFSNTSRTEDRYVPPSERSVFPGSSNYPPYRRDLREEQVGDPRITIPSANDSQRIQGTAPNTPYTENGYKR